MIQGEIYLEKGIHKGAVYNIEGFYNTRGGSYKWRECTCIYTKYIRRKHKDKRDVLLVGQRFQLDDNVAVMVARVNAFLVEKKTPRLITEWDP